MNSIQIQNDNQEKGLDIVISNDLNWDKQCIAAIKQANKVLAMIKGSFLERSKNTSLGKTSHRTALRKN